ncbi:unnamed protein product [Merluccius merluccius]
MVFSPPRVNAVHDIHLRPVQTPVCAAPTPPTAALSLPAGTMAFVPAPSPTVVDQTTLMKKYLQFVVALTETNTPDETKLKMMQEVSENFEVSLICFSLLLHDWTLCKSRCE